MMDRMSNPVAVGHAPEAATQQESDRSGVRRRPVQQRGLATMNAILEAAHELLAERGLEGFTTNAIAERAHINIATLYGYFSDKLAILHEMSERYEAQRAEYLSLLPPRFEQADDWRYWLTGRSTSWCSCGGRSRGRSSCARPSSASRSCATWTANVTSVCRST